MNLRDIILGEIEKNIKLCPVCNGYGKVKAMQSIAVIGGGSVRGVDTQIKCDNCKGIGRYINS